MNSVFFIHERTYSRYKVEFGEKPFADGFMIAEVVYFARVKVPRWLICMCALHFGGEILLFVSFSGSTGILRLWSRTTEPQINVSFGSSAQTFCHIGCYLTLLFRRSEIADKGGLNY